MERLVGALGCVKCGGRLTLTIGSSWTLGSALEVDRGELRCRSCGQVFPVYDGIVDLVVDPSSAAAREIEGNRKMVSADRGGCDDEWLLGLPMSHASLRPDCAEHDEMSDWETMRGQVALRPGDLLLDLGAGTCWSTEQWAAQGVGAVASDISLEKFIGLRSAEVLIRVRGHRFDRVRFDMNKRWPFGSETFDVVVAMSSIHHGDSLSHCLREAARIMKPSATLLLVEATRSIFLRSDATGFGAREIEEFNLNEHLYSQFDYRRAAASAGLSLKLVPAGSFVKKLEMVGNDRGFEGRTALKHRIAYRSRVLLASRMFRALIAGPLFPFVNALVGTQFVGVARKSQNDESRLFSNDADVAIRARER